MLPRAELPLAEVFECFCETKSAIDYEPLTFDLTVFKSLF